MDGNRENMELNINSPAYYANIYGIDEDIYTLSGDIRNFLKSKEYSNIIKIIGICPVVAPKEITDSGKWKESINMQKAFGVVAIFKHIDYDRYVNGTVEVRKKLTIKCVVDSIWLIKKKPGTNFNAKQFEIDLLEFVGYSKEELESI